MVIPAFDEGAWYLPEGIHVADLAEVEARFVDAAPFAAERAHVFAAFRVWGDLVRTLVPEARMWVDGGFVTHKPWAAPSDVDVTFLVTPAALNALSPAEQAQVEKLLTGDGYKPMSGLVDAYLITRGDVDRTVYWRDWWATVVDERHEPVQGVKKGFLEVRS
ncbi:DUF6932 family protein [Plantibacter cousiniae (nom. nud.)]|uniref:Nucleotidyltransferase family protein n=1 Tax=Plantibacter cousiniae (nom. nud.) TaxID=199709 RepID=A0ABY1LJS5_9MICO|nr:hypothetical protein [Plantibacter cousiniae]SKC47501.1 hypothetical protein SAMN06295973_1254 [Plantibacter cousiniae]